MIKVKQFKAFTPPPKHLTRKLISTPKNLVGGFTLVELLVSVAILLLVLGSAVSVEVQSIKLADTNEHSLQAANLAQEQLNLVKTVRDNNIKDYPGPPPEPFKNFPTTPGGTPIASDIKHLVDSSGKFGLADKAITDKTVESNGIKYTIEIRAWDVSAVTLP